MPGQTVNVGALATQAGKAAQQVTDTIAMTAQWRANTYAVSFDANGGIGGQDTDVVVVYDAAMPAISANKPTRIGYTFGG